MKTKLYFPFICLLAISTLAFFSCDSDEDTTKPVIDLHEPEEGEALRIGGTMHVDMDLSDDVMLGSYEIEVHNNFNHHDHDTRATDEETVAFTFNRVYDVSGKKNTYVHEDIAIPANATPGDYHLMINCADAAGNEVHIARNIVLSTDAEEDDHGHEEH